MTKRICTVDVDNAYSVAASCNNGTDDSDAVYWNVTEGDDGWYLSAMLDCATASFTDDLETDDGPYETKKDAVWGGMNCATGWMTDNNHYKYEVCSRTKEILELPQEPAEELKEFTFDVKVFVTMTVKATDRETATKALDHVTTPEGQSVAPAFTAADGIEVHISEGHQDGEPELMMIDGNDVDDEEEE